MRSESVSRAQRKSRCLHLFSSHRAECRGVQSYRVACCRGEDTRNVRRGSERTTGRDTLLTLNASDVPAVLRTFGQTPGRGERSASSDSPCWPSKILRYFSFVTHWLPCAVSMTANVLDHVNCRKDELDHLWRTWHTCDACSTQANRLQLMYYKGSQRSELLPNPQLPVLVL